MMALQPTDFELGWMVGLYDGEGSCSGRRNRKGGTWYGYVEVSMTDEDTIWRLHDVWGKLGNVTSYQRKHKYKRTLKQRMFRLRVTKQDEAREILDLMYPHLSQRRQEQIDAWRERCGT